MAVDSAQIQVASGVTAKIDSAIDKSAQSTVEQQAKSSEIDSAQLSKNIEPLVQGLKQLNEQVTRQIAVVGQMQGDEYIRQLRSLTAQEQFVYVAHELGKHDVAVRELSKSLNQSIADLGVQLQATRMNIAKYGTVREKGVNDDEILHLTDNLYLNIKQFVLQVTTLTHAIGFDSSEYNGGLGTKFAFQDIISIPELDKFLMIPDEFVLNPTGKNSFTYCVDSIIGMEQIDASGTVTLSRKKKAEDLTLALLFPSPAYTVTAAETDAATGRKYVTVTIAAGTPVTHVHAYRGTRAVIRKGLEDILHAAATNIATNYHSLAGTIVGFFGKSIAEWIKGEKASAMFNKIKGLIK